MYTTVLLLTMLTATHPGHEKLPEPVYPSISLTYEEIMYQALNDCPKAFSEQIDKKFLLKLADVERKFKVPKNMRGLLLATVCYKSGFRNQTKNKKHKKIGILKLGKWWTKTYKLDRHDPIKSAEIWMKHLKKTVQSIKKDCGTKKMTSENAWFAAWVKTLGPKSKNKKSTKKKCFRTNLKYHDLLMRWHDRARSLRHSGMGC